MKNWALSVYVAKDNYSILGDDSRYTRRASNLDTLQRLPFSVFDDIVNDEHIYTIALVYVGRLPEGVSRANV